MTPQEPLPCPWCHKNPRVWSLDGSDYSVRCYSLSCGALGPIREDAQQAVAEWNRVAMIVRDASDDHK